MFAIYVCFGIDQTLTVLVLFFITKIFFLKFEEEKLLKKICLFFIRNNKIS